jgi:hypothetical protein
MQKKLLLSFLILFTAIFIYLGKSLDVFGQPCSTDCSKKEIGNFNGISFDPIESPRTLIKGVSYWVKLTIKGQSSISATTPGPTSNTGTTFNNGADIMLIMDTSGSMRSSINKYKDNSTVTIKRWEAARNSLNKFVDLTDESSDYLGIGSFTYCNKYTNTSPFVWAYEGISTDTNKYVGFSALNYSLQSISGKKAFVKNNIINTMHTTDGNPTICLERTGGTDGSTSVGGGLTVGNTMLTPLLTYTNSKRSDGSSYRNSRLGVTGVNNGPLAREYTQNKKVGKYIIIATDGLENEPPKSYDQDLDKSGNTIVDTAKKNGVKIYTILIARPGDAGEPLMKRIASDTGGTFYSANSEEELLASFTSIRDDISEETHVTPGPTISTITGTSSIVQENINNSNFLIADLQKNTSFVLKKYSGGNTTTVTDSCGATLSSCISSKSESSFTLNLPVMTEGEEMYVYFKVNPIAAGENIKVDMDSSTIKYENRPEVPLNNVSVDIEEKKPFYQTQNSGDVYSRGGYRDDLPDEGTFLSTGTNPGIVGFQNSILELGKGLVSTKNWRYRSDVDSSEVIYSKFANGIKNYTVLTENKVISSGIYTFSGDFVVDANTFGELSGKKIVILVNGNLYVRKGIKLPFDGISSVAFIVKRNIGFGSALKDDTDNGARGIFITDGRIDTLCDSLFVGNECSPAEPGDDLTTLRLDGMFVAQEGFNLDRKGDPISGIPAEKFIYRPELIFAAGPQLGSIITTWKEVPPDSQ